MNETQAQVWFFGVGADSAGHYLHSREDAKAWARAVTNELPEKLRCPDTTLCRDREHWPEEEGIAQMHHIAGWTATGFWDRSADDRRGSNANFMVKGRASFATLLKLAKAQYPRLFARFPFEIRLWGPDVDEGAVACFQCPSSPAWSAWLPDSPDIKLHACAAHLVSALSNRAHSIVAPLVKEE